LRKKWPRKWPRLLQNKKTKIGNMHVWMETQERISGQLGGLSTVSNSPVTCAEKEKLYCSVTDSCKMPGNCSQCPNKPEADEAEHICAGVPTQKASINFKDVDLDRHEVSGTIKISKAQHDFESSGFAVYWGQNDTKFEMEGGVAALIGEVTASGGSDQHLSLSANTKIPENATHLLVFSKNSYGEHASPGSETLKDAFLPMHPPQAVRFEDKDGDKNEVKGDVEIDRAEDQSTIEQYSIYWGKSATQRIDKKRNHTAHYTDIEKKEKKYFMEDSTTVPKDATHILVYSKNEHGEHPSPAAVEIVDNLKPCQEHGDDDCPAGLTVTKSAEGKAVLSIQRAKVETGILAYVLYWGESDCESEMQGSGHLRYLAVEEETLEHELPSDTEVPEATTHVTVYTQNRFGEARYCVAQTFSKSEFSFADASADTNADQVAEPLEGEDQVAEPQDGDDPDAKQEL